MPFSASLLRRLPGLGTALMTLFVLSPLSARAQDAKTLPLKGPLPPRDPEPLITLFLQPTPTDAFVLNRARTRWDANLDIANNLLTVNEPTRGRRYDTDFEEQRLSLGYARGLGHGQEIGLRTVLVARNGGLFDGFINEFHKAFGFKGGGRASLPSNRVLYVIHASDGSTIADSTRRVSGLGDTVLEYRRRLTALPEEADRHTLAASARALLKLPTGNYREQLGSGAIDAAGGIAVTWRPNRRLAFHGNASLVFLGDSRLPNLSVRRTGVQSLVAAEYLFDGRTSLLLQSDDAPAPFDSGIAYPDRPRRAFTFGFWRQTNEQNRLFLSLSENDFGPFAKHTSDFVLSTGLRRNL